MAFLLPILSTVKAFRRMIADALDGKIDLLLQNQSVGFASNTVDSLYNS